MSTTESNQEELSYYEKSDRYEWYNDYNRAYENLRHFFLCKTRPYYGWASVVIKFGRIPMLRDLPGNPDMTPEIVFSGSFEYILTSEGEDIVRFYCRQEGLILSEHQVFKYLQDEHMKLDVVAMIHRVRSENARKLAAFDDNDCLYRFLYGTW